MRLPGAKGSLAPVARGEKLSLWSGGASGGVSGGAAVSRPFWAVAEWVQTASPRPESMGLCFESRMLVSPRSASPVWSWHPVPSCPVLPAGKRQFPWPDDHYKRRCDSLLREREGGKGFCKSGSCLGFCRKALCLAHLENARQQLEEVSSPNLARAFADTVVR